jgi:hypothetical protein
MAEIGTLKELHGQSRVLLLFGGSCNEPDMKEQVQLLEDHAPGFRTRDLVLLMVPEDETDASTSLPLHTVSQQERESLRRAYDVAPGHVTLVLIGKDGGQKLLTAGPIDPERIYDLIDTMPMRQAEMRRRRR